MKNTTKNQEESLNNSLSKSQGIDLSKVFDQTIGKSFSESIFSGLSKTQKPASKTYPDGSTYHCWPLLGISTLTEPPNQKIDSIYVFFNDKRYKPFKGVLPYNLDIKMTNGDVVSYLGEPEVKSGGKLNFITLNYQRIGVEIEFFSKVWEVGDAPIKSVCLYPIDPKFGEGGDNFICAVCRKKTTKICSRCKMVYYCCREHQLLHWKVHKKFCKKLKKKVE